MTPQQPRDADRDREGRRPGGAPLPARNGAGDKSRPQAPAGQSTPRLAPPASQPAAPAIRFRAEVQHATSEAGRRARGLVYDFGRSAGAPAAHEQAQPEGGMPV